MKRTAPVLLILLFASATSYGARRRRVIDTVRHHTGRALRSVGDEIQSWMRAVNQHARGVRRGVGQGIASVKRAGRQTVTQVQRSIAVARKQATREVYKAFTTVAREFVPAGTRPETTAGAAPTAVTSAILAPLFLRHHDIVLAWHASTNGRPFRRSMALNDRLLLEDAGHDVYSFDPFRGDPQWIYPLPARSQYDFRADKDGVVIISQDILFDLDRVIGRARQRYILPFATSCQPALHGDDVVIGAVDNRIHAFNRLTRGKHWGRLSAGHIEAGLALSGPTAYAAHTDGTVVAFVPGSPRPVWTYKAHDAVRVSPVLYGDHLYFPAEDFFVHAVNRISGFRVWKYPTRGLVTQPPCVTRETVYFSAQGDGFYAVTRDKGEKLWYIANGHWPVAIGKKNIYLHVGTNDIWCVDRTTGKKVWSVSAAPFTHFVRNIDGDRMFLATGRGQVYCLYVRGDHVEKKRPPVAPLRPPAIRPPEGPATP